MSMNVNGKAQINVTPLIDILLVLIIIVMVITPIGPRGLQAVAPPQADTPPPGPISREILVSVAATGAIDINSQPVTLEYQAVAHIIDIARGAGWDRIGLMTR